MASSEPELALFQVIRRLATEPRQSQRELASALGMSVGKINYCLRTLIARGLVKAENYRRSDNKLAYFYVLTPSGFAEKAALTRRFLAKKMEEYDALRIEIEALTHERDLAHQMSASKDVSHLAATSHTEERGRSSRSRRP